MSDAENWPNILLLSQLLFSLLITKSLVHVERGFSTMKVLKTERCTWLLTNTLDDLIEINLEGPTPEYFSAGDAVQLWYQDRTRPNQSARKECCPRPGSQRERKALLIPNQQKTSFHLMTGINYLQNCGDYHVVSVTRHCIQVYMLRTDIRLGPL